MNILMCVSIGLFLIGSLLFVFSGNMEVTPTNDLWDKPPVVIISFIMVVVGIILFIAWTLLYMCFVWQP